MPWRETCVMDLKVRLIGDYLTQRYSVTELARSYSVSRKTVYKWIERYAQDGADGLKERSRAPRSCPHSINDEIAQQIIETKLAHPSWGPKKVLDLLRREQPHQLWPADSTAGEVLKRAGLVKPRRRRRRVPPDVQQLSEFTHSNQCWSADFKGDFLLGNGQRCYPLTVTDNHSRFLLHCQGLRSTGYQGVREAFELVFREFGLPASIRTDNGVPFAAASVTGLSQLSKWWLDLEIRPERIRPGRPTENSRHERMHRSLKAAVCKPPAYNGGQQQERFDVFRVEFNDLRSHEGLNRKTPTSVYIASTRQMPERIRPAEYDGSYQVRSVRHNGEIKWQGALVYVGELLAGTRVGLKQIDNQRWLLQYRSHILGVVNEGTRKVEPAGDWHSSTEGGDV